MNAMILISIILQVIVPIILVSIIAFTYQPGLFHWICNSVSFGAVILFLYLTARWELTSVYLRFTIPIIWLVAIMIGFRRIKKPEKRIKIYNYILIGFISVGLAIFMGGFIYFSLKGYTRPDNAIELQYPIRDSRTIILHGGRSPTINGHFHVVPQNFAIDILGLNIWGNRGALLSPNELKSYEIYDERVYSPCSGKIVAVVDCFNDLIPPKTDPENPAGNHVLIECEEIEVLLAHLKKNSIQVLVGDEVTTESIIGKVGNSGNTSEPHLHIHAEKGGEPGKILDGVGVPITFNDRFLVRGSIVDPGRGNGQ